MLSEYLSRQAKDGSDREQ